VRARAARRPPSQRFNRADLQAMAEDGNPAGDGDRLLRAAGRLAESDFGASMPLTAAFIHHAGDVAHSRRWGWPEDLASLHHTSTFSDVYTLASSDPPALRGRKGWMHDAWWDEWIDPRLGRATLLIRPYHLTTPLLLIALAWIMGLVLRAALRCVRRANRLGARQPLLTRHLPLLCALAMLACIVVLSLGPTTGDPGRWPATVWPPTATTTLTRRGLRALHTSPAPDRTIARAIRALASRRCESGYASSDTPRARLASIRPSRCRSTLAHSAAAPGWCRRRCRAAAAADRRRGAWESSQKSRAAFGGEKTQRSKVDGPERPVHLSKSQRANLHRPTPRLRRSAPSPPIANSATDDGPGTWETRNP